MKTFSWPEKTELKTGQIERKRYRKEEDEERRIGEGKLKAGEEYTAKTSGDKYSFDSSWRLFRKAAGKGSTQPISQN